MRILVTGSCGYLGAIVVPFLQRAGHEVVGLDSGLFRDNLHSPTGPSFSELDLDLRDVTSADLAGFEGVAHLAALSNDPLGNLDPQLTYDINHLATVRLARAAREAGVSRFVFSSSCSTYGAAGDDFLAESAEFHPVTPYGESKVLAERDLATLADDHFTPVFLRNATAYGYSPRLRLDLVLNDFVAAAMSRGAIVIKSDGTPWRPVVHVEDIALAFLAALTAPRESVFNQAFNIGQTSENFRVSELAEMVSEACPNSRIEYAPGGSPDKRCYRVDCSKAASRLPGFRPRWTVPQGARELATAFARFGVPDLAGGDVRFLRLPTLRAAIRRGDLTSDLRRSAPSQAARNFLPQEVVS